MEDVQIRSNQITVIERGEKVRFVTSMENKAGISMTSDIVLRHIGGNIYEVIKDRTGKLIRMRS